MRGQHPINRGASIKTRLARCRGPANGRGQQQQQGREQKKRREASGSSGGRWKGATVEEKSGWDDFSRRPFEGRAPRSSARSFNSRRRDGGQRGTREEEEEKKKDHQWRSRSEGDLFNRRRRTLLSSSVSIPSSDNPIDLNAHDVYNSGRISKKINSCVLLIKMLRKKKREEEYKILVIDTIINRQYSIFSLFVLITSTHRRRFNWTFDILKISIR